MIDEYVVDYEEYPAIGSGGITYLGDNLFVNTFSVNDYNAAIAAGRMSLMGKTTFSLRDRMRYRFMMQLFGLRLDKRQFERDFGCTVEAGLPVEMAFMKASGAFDRDTRDELTLTPRGPLPHGGHDAPVLHRREQPARSGARRPRGGGARTHLRGMTRAGRVLGAAMWS